MEDLKNIATTTSKFAAAVAPVAVLNYTLPFVLKTLANKALSRIPGYKGSLQEVEVRLIQGRLSLKTLRMEKNYTREESALFFLFQEFSVEIEWSRLLSGALVADLVIDRPVLDFDYKHWQPADKSRPDPERRQRLRSWQESVRSAFPFQIRRIFLKSGQVRLRNLPGQGTDVLEINELFLTVKNLTNREPLFDSAQATFECRAEILSGRLESQAKFFPFEEQPTINGDLAIRGIALTGLRNLFRHFVGADIREGTFDFFAEGAAAKGLFKGYVKPVIDKLRLEPAKDGSLLDRAKAWSAKAAVKLLRNEEVDRIATRVPFEGSLEDPGIKVVSGITNFLKNAFRQAFHARLDYRVAFRAKGTQPSEIEIDYEKKKPGRFAQAFGLVKSAASRWSKDEATRMAASLSYYTTFSLAPLLILVIAVAGLAFGHDAAQGKIIGEIAGLVGQESAKAIQSMIAAAQKPTQGVIATIISLVTLFGGASGVLSELKQALNRIWSTQEAGSLGEIVKARAKYFGLILGIGFLLLVSLVMSAGLAAFGGWIGNALSVPAFIPKALEAIVSLAVVTSLFALMFKYLPDVEVAWKDVWFGAAVTSLLFTVGKFGLGLYLGKSSVSSSYGAAGSVLILLLWVYYSALILYFGAEFTRVYAESYGSHRLPARRRPS